MGGTGGGWFAWFKSVKPGLYTIELHVDGEIKTVEVDQFFPRFKYERFHKVEAFWSLIIEKAMAKYYRTPDYKLLEEGLNLESFQNFTPYLALANTLDNPPKNDFSFETLKSYWDKGYPMVVTKMPKRENVSGKVVESGHDYAVVGVLSRAGGQYLHIFDPNNLPAEAYQKDNSKFNPQSYCKGYTAPEELKGPTFEIPFDFLGRTCAWGDSSKLENSKWLGQLTVGFYDPNWKTVVETTSNYSAYATKRCIGKDRFKFTVSGDTESIIQVARPWERDESKLMNPGVELSIHKGTTYPKGTNQEDWLTIPTTMNDRYLTRKVTLKTGTTYSAIRGDDRVHPNTTGKLLVKFFHPKNIKLEITREEISKEDLKGVKLKED